jgi:hypothetical protein
MNLKHEYEKLIGLINKCLKHSDYTDEEDTRIYKIKTQIDLINSNSYHEGMMCFPTTDGGSRRKLEMMRAFARKKVKELT